MSAPYCIKSHNTLKYITGFRPPTSAWLLQPSNFNLNRNKTKQNPDSIVYIGCIFTIILKRNAFLHRILWSKQHSSSPLPHPSSINIYTIYNQYVLQYKAIFRFKITPLLQSLTSELYVGYALDTFFQGYPIFMPFDGDNRPSIQPTWYLENLSIRKQQWQLGHLPATYRLKGRLSPNIKDIRKLEHISDLPRRSVPSVSNQNVSPPRQLLLKEIITLGFPQEVSWETHF